MANTANVKLSPKGSGMNRTLHLAAGPELEQATRAAWPPRARPGEAYPVRLSESCPVRRNEGIEWVIHVHGPNMHPHRPNCLEGDYVAGCEQLRSTYAALFASFVARL